MLYIIFQTGREAGEGGRRRKRESGSKMMVFTNTYCMYMYPVASIYVVSCHHSNYKI